MNKATPSKHGIYQRPAVCHLHFCTFPPKEVTVAPLLFEALEYEWRFFSSGDELYARYCKDESNRDMEMAWDILDWYKKAVLLTHELEVEIEAIAISRIGRLYDQVFKIKSKARESFKAAIALALSMHPRTFNNDGETYSELRSFLISFSFV